MVCSFQDSMWVGRTGLNSCQSRQSPTLTDSVLANVIPRQFDCDALAGIFLLPSQLRLCSRGMGRCQWARAPWDIVGDSTSAGAENSQSTLHADRRPTMTAYFHRSIRTSLPRLFLSPSESSIPLQLLKTLYFDLYLAEVLS